MSDHKQAYAKAMLEVATAEGQVEQVADELHEFSSALDSSRQLYTTLSDAGIPAERRQQIIQDLLSKKANRITLGLISMLISNGRVKDLSDIVGEFNKEVARQKKLEVAYIRTAVELNDSQKAKLKKALNQATNKELDLKLVVDPNLLGGVVATIGDTVIDGSVKTRLQKLKETLEREENK